MIRKATSELPHEYRNSQGVIDLMHEEDALCWLWAFPSLFKWRSPIVWLYTVVVGNRRWPGDLWGVDCRGNLLIVEAKQCKRSDDPFKDFEAVYEPGKREFTATHWIRKWEKHWKAETSFENGYSERPPGRTDGILPRSNRRQHMRRWKRLTIRIDKYIRSPKYSTTVYRYLQIRGQSGNPTPYYFALMIESGKNRKMVSDNAKASERKLKIAVGKDNVATVAIYCERYAKDRVVARSRRIDFLS